MIGSLPAVLLVVFQTEGTDLGQLGKELVSGEDAVVLPLVDVRVDLGFDE